MHEEKKKGKKKKANNGVSAQMCADLGLFE